MLKKLLCLALVSMALGGIIAEEQYFTSFQGFKLAHNKEYSCKMEHEYRFQIFKSNMDKIIAHNAGDSTFEMEMNEFGDMTAEEFKEKMISGIPSVNVIDMEEDVFTGEGVTVASSIDWSAKSGMVTPVKNQGQCGSCWSFSTTGAIESSVAIKTGQLASLSEQMLVDCSTANYGCSGGWPQYAMDYVNNQGGLCTESAYPYTAQDGSCRSSSCSVRSPISGRQQVQAYSASALKAALNLRPVSILIEADQTSFQFYSGGVLTSDCGHSLDHAVLAVGYGTTSNGVDYWKVKNSWGASWGSNGYILLQRNVDAPYGLCGILSSNYIAIAK